MFGVGGVGEATLGGLGLGWPEGVLGGWRGGGEGAILSGCRQRGGRAVLGGQELFCMVGGGGWR